MSATEQLKEEHKGIKLALSILGEICKRLEAGKRVDPDHLEQILEFIRVFADKCHHGKEEGILFPAMEEAGIPAEGGPVGVMLQEHAQGRNHVKEMAEGICEYKAAGSAAAPKIVKGARNYIALLTSHIDKEDNMLYPIAEAHIPQNKQEQLAREFEKIELEKMGAGTHEKFHGILRHLKDAYLK